MISGKRNEIVRFAHGEILADARMKSVIRPQADIIASAISSCAASISSADRRISLGSYQNKRFDTTPFDTDFLCPLTLRIPGTLPAASGGDLFYPARRPPPDAGTGIRSISYAPKRKTFIPAAEKSAGKSG